MTNVQQQKLLFSQRWKHRRAPRPKAVVALAPTSMPIAAMPSLPPIPAAEPLTAADRARIARWVASRIVTWASDNCFHCRRPIVYGAKWSSLSTIITGLVFISIASLRGGRSRKSQRVRRWGSTGVNAHEAHRRLGRAFAPSRSTARTRLPALCRLSWSIGLASCRPRSRQYPSLGERYALRLQARKRPASPSSTGG